MSGMHLPRTLVEHATATVASRRADAAPDGFNAATYLLHEAGQGSLFFSLSTDATESQRTVERALLRGSAAVVCVPGAAAAFDRIAEVYAVDTPLTAYRALARLWREQFSIPVIVVAGSAGKTTTTALLAAALSGHWPSVARSEPNQNGFVGIPTTLLRLRPDHRAAVVEVGIDAVDAMQDHLRIVQPTAGLITVIGAEHLEFLKDVDTVAAEQRRLFADVDARGGTVAINLDDPWLRPSFDEMALTCARIGYTMTAAPTHPSAGHARIACGRLDDPHTLAVDGLFDGGDGGDATFRLPLPGRHNAANLLAAVSLASQLGASAREIADGLATFETPEGRSQVLHLPGPITVIADCYNANPLSMHAALDMLSAVASGDGRVRERWACLGDMTELGPDEERFHRELAVPILSARIEHVRLFGDRMRALHGELIARGFQGDCRHAGDLASLAAELASTLKAGDVLLVKGSRSQQMDRIVEGLTRRRRHA